MDTKFNSPDFFKINYLREDSGKYAKVPDLVPFEGMPEVLKVESTQIEGIRRNGADQIITGPIRKKKREFFTGLIPVPEVPGSYWGNDYEQKGNSKKNSLVIFRFSPDFKSLSVFYFRGFYKDSRLERVRFVTNFLKSI